MPARCASMAAMAVLVIAFQAEPTRAAEPYPSRPIKLIVPFGPGGQPDIMARLIAEQLTARIGPVVVDNRIGAGGTIGARAAASAEPDGHTLLLGTLGVLAISPAVFKSAGYDPVKSFTPVAMVSTVPFVLVASAKAPVTNARELIAHAKAHPGKLNSGAANGTPPHLACEQFKRAAALEIVHVPYKSMSQALSDLVSGEVQVVCEATTVLLPLIQAGHATPLAVMSATRLPELPNVPTMAELGIQDLVVTAWVGVVAPTGTPAAIIDRLNAVIGAGVQSAEVRAGLARLGASPNTGSPQEFATFIAAEVNRWGETVRSIGLKAE